MIVSENTIKKCKNNNRKAQKKIYEAYSDIVFAISLRYLKNRTQAEDNMHETFVIVFDKIYQYSGKGSFEGWVKRIAVNNALMHLRESKKEIIADDFSYFESKSVNKEKEKEDLDPKNVRQVIERANFESKDMLELVSKLPEGFRTVFNLYAIEGYKHKEIAAKLGIAAGTSKSQFARARIKLQEILYEAALEKIRT